MKQLKSFQEAGVKFLTETRRAILGDDMGLGKTIQAIKSADRLAPVQLKLVVCPNMLRHNWAKEILDCSSQVRNIYVVPDKMYERERFFQEVRKLKSDAWVVIHYEFMLKHADELAKMKWAVVIWDEAHTLKNRKTKTTKAHWKFRNVPSLLYLTGTPMMNRAYDVWPLLRNIDIKTYGSYWKTVQQFHKLEHNGFGWKVGELLRPGILAEKLSGIFLRRKKEEVLTELPPITIQQVWVDLPPAQRNDYESMKKNMLAEIQGVEIQAPIVIAKLTRLRQFALDPTLSDPDCKFELGGPKVTALLDIIESAGDQKVIVFSQFAKALMRLQQTLSRHDIPSLVLTGETPTEDREEILKEFKEAEAPGCLLLSLKAGGQGLNLTEAPIAVLLDKAWTPAINEQAYGRVHRMGQQLPVTVYEILARETVDEYIEEVLSNKATEINSVLNHNLLKRVLN